MSANTVHVTNISSSTSEKEIKDFFSFCGKISDIKVTPTGETQEAKVIFEKETAAKTALLLDNTQLGRTQVSVSGAEGAKEVDDSPVKDSDEITQEQKPRSRIIAEYLAHGYTIGDTAAQRALDMDKKHGLSARFLQTLQNLDNKYHATEKAKTADQSYGITAKAQGVFHSLVSYYEKAAETPTGKKIVDFYSQTAQQVEDIHKEARRLADLKKSETCKCGASSTECKCAPGSCDCNACENKAKDVHPIASGSDKTVCSCGGSDAKCACAPGHCACSSCPKSAGTAPSAHEVATGGTEPIDSTKIQPLEPTKQ
jgi:hypothetical protein